MAKKTASKSLKTMLPPHSPAYERLSRELKNAVDILVTDLSFTKAAEAAGMEMRKLREMYSNRGDFHFTVKEERDWRITREKMSQGRDWAIVELAALFDKQKRRNGATANGIMKTLADLCGWTQPTMLIQTMSDARDMSDDDINKKIKLLSKNLKKAIDDEQDRDSA